MYVYTELGVKFISKAAAREGGAIQISAFFQISDNDNNLIYLLIYLKSNINRKIEILFKTYSVMNSFIHI